MLKFSIQFLLWTTPILIAFKDFAFVIEKYDCRERFRLKHDQSFSLFRYFIACNLIKTFFVKNLQQTLRHLVHLTIRSYYRPIVAFEFNKEQFVCDKLNLLYGSNSLLSDKIYDAITWLRLDNKSDILLTFQINTQDLPMRAIYIYSRLHFPSFIVDRLFLALRRLWIILEIPIHFVCQTNVCTAYCQAIISY